MTTEPLIGPEVVRAQLERMIASQLFRNSKRYPGFLRFVVEHSLTGDREHLKERTLGVEVFGRDPDYDTNDDPVVRVTAGEVRKRIAQYYHEPAHQSELRIDLPPGSYFAEFHWQPKNHEPAVLEPGVIRVPQEMAAPLPQTPKLWTLALMGLGCATALVLAAVWFWPSHRTTLVDRFWAPVLEQEGNAIVCVGQRRFVAPMGEADTKQFHQLLLPRSEEPKQYSSVPLSQLYYLGSQNIALVDSIALTRIVSLLEAKGKKVQIRGEQATNLDDLRRQPAVLIGGFSNDWSLLFTSQMRFRFQRNGEKLEVADQRNPEDHSVSVNLDLPYSRLEQDYALVTRERDPNTDRFILVFGGIMGFGTQAAGEFLTNSSYMSAFLKDAPPDWEKKNLQIILGTKIIKGTAGPPYVIASYFW
jgi:hypothetical protein